LEGNVNAIGTGYGQNAAGGKKVAAARDTTDWNSRGEFRADGPADGPVSSGNQLQWDDKAMASASASVERVKDLLGESSGNELRTGDSIEEFSRRIADSSEGRGLADNVEPTASGFEKPNSMEERNSKSAQESEAASDEAYVSLELGYNLQNDLLEEVRKTMRGTERAKKKPLQAAMESQFAFVGGTKKSDLAQFKEATLKPN
jgi:hypothetical protein